MVQFKKHQKAYLKAAMIFIAVTLSVAYVVFSYNQTISNIQNKNRDLLLQEKKEISEALQQLNQFLNLTSSRVINSIEVKERIPTILSLRLEHLTHKNFPELLSLTFNFTSDPHTIYSRYGKTEHRHERRAKKGDSAVTYLGQGQFQLEKTLYDNQKKALGTLQVAFSIKHLLYKHFSENEIHVIAGQQNKNQRTPLSFTLPNLPYVFVLNLPLPTFWQFLWGFKSQAFLILILNFISLTIGMMLKALLNKKRMLKHHVLNQQISQDFKQLESKNQTLINQNLLFQNLLK